MSTVEQLLTPIIGGGVRTVNFFNGRMLSGEDMSDEQEAQRRGRRLLGQAAGEGVASGLEVSEARDRSTRQSPVVNVEAGLAVNRRGHTLALKERTAVALTRQAGASNAPQTAGSFGDCQPLQPGTYVVGESVYLLTLAPAEGRQGRAPAAGFGGIQPSCGTRYTVEGVQFRLVELATSTTLGDLRSLRNRIAYECFGVEEKRDFQRDPFGKGRESRGLLDAYRPDVITDCEVPLALIHWTISGGIEFVDMWSVRRRQTGRAAAGHWESLVGDRAASEAEAMLLQFQVQAAELFDAPDPAKVAAADHFRYLPPVGVLPVKAGGFDGFDLNVFFGGRVVGKPEYVGNALVRSLFVEAAGHEPLDVTKGEPVRLYQTWLGAHPIVGGKAAQPSVVFASPYLTHLVAARLDVARFDESTYAGGRTAEAPRKLKVPALTTEIKTSRAGLAGLLDAAGRILR